VPLAKVGLSVPALIVKADRDGSLLRVVKFTTVEYPVPVELIA